MIQNRFRMHRAFPSLCALVLLPGLMPGTSPAQTPEVAAWQAVERARILEGVTAIPKIGSPGPVAVWGDLAFAVLAAAEGGAPELALAAAAVHGKGRIMVIGHDGYVAEAAAGDGGLGRLLRNAVRWAGAKERPSVGVKGTNLTGFLKKEGFQAGEIRGPLTRQTLGGHEVVILGAQRMTGEAEGQAVLEYLKGGGGVIAAMTGWAFEQTSGGQVLSRAHGLNRALVPAGLAFTDATGFGSATLREFRARTELPRMMNAADALAAITAQGTDQPPLTLAEINQGASAVQLALAAQPPEGSPFQSIVMSALRDDSFADVPTKEQPLTQARHAAQRLRLSLETRMLRLVPGTTAAAHPAAAVFPGQPADGAPRVTQEVLVDPAINGWTSTGLYAVAGEPFTVTVPGSMVGTGYAIRTGCHTDTLYHLESWKRAPDIVRTTAIEAPETRAGTAFGGLIYIDVPAKARTGAPGHHRVKISGAVAAPYFRLGRDSDEQWNTEIKQSPAPWAELAGEKMVLSVPAEAARKVTNPAELMAFWDRIVTAQDDIANQTAERIRPERMVADVQISAGFMHSGYPIMIHTPEALEMVTYGRIKFPGWGYYHEIGHNHQRGGFTFEGTGEVTNNVFGLYCYTEVLKKDLLIGHSEVSPEQIRKRIELMKKMSRPEEKWALWKSNPFHALTTYIQLVQGFGWESYKRYIWSFGDPSFGPDPKSDAEKRDQFLVRFSKITGKNLGPFFDFWGIPVSNRAKADVGGLPVWMPEDL